MSAAQSDYKDIAREREILEALPLAWRQLVADEDELLLELLADAVETRCGYRPELDVVASFLHNSVPAGSAALASQPPKTVRPPGRSRPPAKAMDAHPAELGEASAVGFTLGGKWRACRNARAVLVGVIEALAALDPTFSDRFVGLARHGRSRRYIAVNREDLYPDRPDLVAQQSHQLRNGYWLGVNVSRRQIE